MSSDRLPLPPVPRRSLVYLSGAPAAGKSTLMRHLTRYCPRLELSPSAHAPAREMLRLPTAAPVSLFSPHAVEIGRRREKFSGTDALPMNVVVAAEAYMERTARAFGLVLGEGDRLANRRFLVGSRDAGWHVTLIHLDAPAPILDARCRDRGSTQSAGWRAGRETKAANLATAMLAEGIDVCLFPTASLPPDRLAAAVVARVPVLAALLPPDAPEVQP